MDATIPFRIGLIPGEGTQAGEADGAASSKAVEYPISVVEYYGYSANYCGYCKRDETESEGRRSYDIKAHVLRASDYQQLLDRGWRRSGNFCYRTINSLTCCPNYPLSCDALRFKLSKSQRRCIENLNSFLVNGTIQEKLRLDYGLNNEQRDTKARQLIESKSFEELKTSLKARDKRFVASCERKIKLYNLTLDEAIERTRKNNAIRNKQNSRVATLEDYLYPNTTNLPKQLNTLQCKHSLRIKMHYVNSQDSRSLRVEENKLIQRYQKEVHKESPEEWTMSKYSSFLINSPIVVEPFSEQHMDGIYNDDTLTKEIPNKHADHLLVKPPDLPTAYGTYHCVYYLDGKMIAVGVLDVLPKCLTTVYFFYDPEYGYLNLGTYSALVEISMVRQMYKHYKNQSKLIYYYLGFYVHECKKMHYKTKFFPSHLLCSETHRFVPLETCLKLLEDRKYARFYLPEATGNHNHGDCDVQESDNSELSIFDIPVKTSVTSTTKMADYFNWIDSNFGEEYVRILIQDILLPYIKLIGPSVVPRICLRMESIHRTLIEKHRRQTNRR